MSHPEQSNPELSSELSALKAKFEAWRSDRTKSGKIPIELREAVLALLKHSKSSRILSPLGIYPQQVKQWQRQNGELVADNPVTFVPLQSKALAIETVVPECITLQITHPNGATLQISCTQVSSGLSFMQHFIGAA